MKQKLAFTAVVVCFLTLPLFAQNPLVGTWQYQVDTIRTIKIITPTHWMVFTESVKGDVSKFIRSHGGTYTQNGDKYIENIEVASWDNYGKEKTDFTFKIEGDKFYQKGLLTLGDGTKVPVDEVWQKVKSDKSYPNAPALGTWNYLSSSSTMADGTKYSYTNATATRVSVITPTHWILIGHRNKKFEYAGGGTYTRQGNKAYPQLEFSSSPINKAEKIEITHRIEGNKRYGNGIVKDATGKTIRTFEDVYQKVNGKSNKIALTK